MSFPDDPEPWFGYTKEDEFNQRGDESPTDGGQYNFDSAPNIDNIPLNDDGLGDFEIEYPLSPGFNDQHHQPGTNGGNDMGGLYQSMTAMHNDTFDPHIPSSDIQYNSFEQPTVISTNLDAGPYPVLGIDDPNSYYANQQPSTSQGNDMLLNEGYDMMGQQTTYMAQVDLMNPSPVGHPSLHSGMNQHNDNGVQAQQQQQQPTKAKKKKAPPKKKPTVPAPDTVGSVLTKANKMTQERQQSSNVENGGTKVETRISTEDSMIVQELMSALMRLKADTSVDHSEEITNIEAQIVQLFSKNVSHNVPENNVIFNQMKSMTGNNESSLSTTTPLANNQKKSNAAKNSKNQKKNQQQSQLQPQQHQMAPPQAQIAPARIVMEPPTTTMVPSNSHMQNMYEGVNENYGYHNMDEQGTSHQQYNEFQQPQSQESIHQIQHRSQPQVTQAKVVPTMNQRTHNYRQSVALPSQNSNGPGPSPHLRQPQSHESHHMDQMHEQQYHAQDHQRPQSRQMFAPAHQHHQDIQSYPSQDPGPTLGDVVRQTQGRYQGPQDAPNLRQQLISNVNASTTKQMRQKSQAPTPPPVNYHNNNSRHPQHQQYGEPYQHHSSYPSSHDMQPNSHSQQGYDNHHQYDQVDNFYDRNQVRSQEPQMIRMQPEVQHQQFEQQEMYAPIQEPVVDESEMYYVEIPERTAEVTKEKIKERQEEKRLERLVKVKDLMTEQLSKLDGDIDVTPFRGKMDILERLLPFHHFSVGEEPVAKFDSTYKKVMTNAFSHANALGNRIRNIVLRESMRTSTEWEENMILFLETESERRKLEEDRKLADQDVQSFLQNSDIIHNLRNRRLSLERSRQAAPPIPEHLQEINLQPGELSAFYKEYEFDSYDENRPRGSPFVYEPESETESDQELEEEEEDEEEEDEQPTRSDISPHAEFPQPSSVPSPSRDRFESESTAEWKDDDESPLLSPETEIYKKVTEDLFGTQEDLEKAEPFPFEEISDAARKQHELVRPPRATESVGSSGGSSTTSGSTPRNTDQPKARPTSPKPSTHLHAVEECSLSPEVLEVLVPSPARHSVRFVNLAEGSPEIGDDYSMSPESPPPPPKARRKKKSEPKKAEEIAPIPLPVPVNMIKEEKDDSAPKLRLRVPVAIVQKGIEMAGMKDDDDVQFIPKESLKIKVNLSSTKRDGRSPSKSASRPNSRSRPVTSSSGSTMDVENSTLRWTSKTSVRMADDSPISSPINETHAFKTPLPTSLMSESRKRRSERIDGSTPQSKMYKDLNSFTTPKNGMVQTEDAPIGRFLRTMTEGRKLVMKIGKIPDNINHFVTPRRDKKGNLHKDLSPTKNTRLKMRFFKRNGELAVQVTEHFPDKVEEERLDRFETPSSSEPSTSCASFATPSIPSSLSAKGRPAPASRKSSIDVAGKDKKNSLTKNKSAYTNRFNPFANASSSKPSTSAMPSSSKPSALSMQSSSKLSTSSLPNSVRSAKPSYPSSSKPSSSTISNVSKPSLSAMSSAVRTPPVLAMSSMKSVPLSKPKESVSRAFAMPTGLSPASVPKIPAQAVTAMNLIKTTPIIPKITVSNSPVVPENAQKPKESNEMNDHISSLLPWMFKTNNSSDQKPAQPKPQPTPTSNAISVTTTTKDHLKATVDRSEDHATAAQQEAERASSSLSMSFFEDDKANGFPFLHSPKRTSEPLPVVEFSDDEEDDRIHSTFSHATDHLLGTSKMNKPVNGAAPFPWSSDS